MSYISRDEDTEQHLVQSSQWSRQHLVPSEQLRPGWDYTPSAQPGAKGKWGQRGKQGGAAGAGGRGRGGRGRGRGRGRRGRG